jgi:hypothetical protein
MEKMKLTSHDVKPQKTAVNGNEASRAAAIPVRNYVSSSSLPVAHDCGIGVMVDCQIRDRSY